MYDVDVPNDAENIKLDGSTTIYRCNKILLSNPRKVTDELSLHFYEISDIPEKSYYKTLCAVCLMNYKKTALAIFRDKINSNTIDLALSEWNDFMNSGGDGNTLPTNETVELINNMLNSLINSQNVK